MTKIISIYMGGANEDGERSLRYAPVGEYFGRPVPLGFLLNQLTVQDNDHVSLYIKGRGVESSDIRDLGGIFSFYQEEQVIKVAETVKKLISSEEHLVLNIYGFSAGGAGAFWLCTKLIDISPKQLTINLVVYDPVPGNFIFTGYIDRLLSVNFSFTAKIADLTKCNNLKKALILLGNQPLTDIMCHAPIVPKFPEACEVSTDVMPGCHAESVRFSFETNSTKDNKFKLGEENHFVTAKNEKSVLVFQRIISCMEQYGTKFDFTKLNLSKKLRDVYINNISQNYNKYDNQEKFYNLIQLFDMLFKEIKNDRLKRPPVPTSGIFSFFSFSPDQRAMHLGKSILTHRDARYLNRYHKELVDLSSKESKVLQASAGNNDSSNSYLLVIDDKPLPLTGLNVGSKEDFLSNLQLLMYFSVMCLIVGIQLLPEKNSDHSLAKKDELPIPSPRP